MRKCCVHQRSGYVLRYDKFSEGGCEYITNANTAYRIVRPSRPLYDANDISVWILPCKYYLL